MKKREIIKILVIISLIINNGICYAENNIPGYQRSPEGNILPTNSQINISYTNSGAASSKLFISGDFYGDTMIDLGCSTSTTPVYTLATPPQINTYSQANFYNNANCTSYKSGQTSDDLWILYDINNSTSTVNLTNIETGITNLQDRSDYGIIILFVIALISGIDFIRRILFPRINR